ncbi:hypothetical protein B9Z31_12835 [Limnohabitans sp. G3-2]|nr:hypothetical protein B9Z31_12835 [Limnohabitans sp. G3-2]
MPSKKSVIRPVVLAVSALFVSGLQAQTVPPRPSTIYIEQLNGQQILGRDQITFADGLVGRSDWSVDALLFSSGGNSSVLSSEGLLAGGVQASQLRVTGSVDFTGAQITGLRQFDPTQAGALSGVTTLNAGSTYNMDLQTGTARLGDLSTSGEARVGGTLDVTGATTLSGATTVNSTLSVTGATTIVGATSVTGATTIVGTTNINTTGNAATRIGNAGAAATVVGNVVTATAGNSALALQNGEARVTVTNSLGNTHGLVVGESSTTLSGGTSSTNLTLNDNGATFSNAATGAPTRVTGVANGSGDFDAVNVRQFSAAVAGVAASANIPGLDTNKAVSVGVGMGSYMNAQALAFGGSYRFSDKGVLRATLATGLNSGGGKTSFGIGAGWSW